MKKLEIMARILVIGGYVGKCAICHGGADFWVTITATAGVVILNGIGFALLSRNFKRSNKEHLVE